MSHAHFFVYLLQVLRHLIAYPVPHLISLYALLQVLRHLIVHPVPHLISLYALLQVLRHLIVYPVPHLISLYALLQVLRHLIVCLEKGSMPHFFVPACNLLAHYSHQELLSTSQRLREIHDEFCNNPALSIRLQC